MLHFPALDGFDQEPDSAPAHVIDHVVSPTDIINDVNHASVTPVTVPSIVPHVEVDTTVPHIEVDTAILPAAVDSEPIMVDYNPIALRLTYYSPTFLSSMILSLTLFMFLFHHHYQCHLLHLHQLILVVSSHHGSIYSFSCVCFSH
ncbi:hypothetical protein Syun_010050 [Stephania yunnanensis]|uniref:Uncharacterized protein n=1 Tax=Stephania yunnanensis TaxID=152371 RepID=A0AAP0KFR0_9MAGN